MTSAGRAFQTRSPATEKAEKKVGDNRSKAEHLQEERQQQQRQLLILGVTDYNVVILMTMTFLAQWTVDNDASAKMSTFNVGRRNDV